ncbi:MAG: BT4734/BF3469 family protein [Rikenellaceae bacterium]
MISYKSHTVSLFRRVTSKYPSDSVNLWEWLLTKNEYTHIVDELRACQDPERCKVLKQRLPAVTVSGQFSKRQADCIERQTGLICIDIDGMDNPRFTDMEEAKAEISELPYIIYCGLSASGKGLFCIVQYSRILYHKLHFNALQQEFNTMGINIDPSCSDISRLRLYSYDDNAYINTKAEVYDTISDKTINYHKERNILVSEDDLPIELDMTFKMEDYFKGQNLEGVAVFAESKRQKARRFFQEVIDREIDITEDYDSWIHVAGIIKNLYGELGRELFHNVCKFYPKYTYEESDQTYSSLNVERYRYSSNALWLIGSKYGVHYY